MNKPYSHTAIEATILFINIHGIFKECSYMLEACITQDKACKTLSAFVTVTFGASSSMKIC